LEVERRFSLKHGLLAKFNEKWGAFLAEQEHQLFFILDDFLFSVFVVSLCAWMWREQRNFYHLFFLILAAI